MWLDPYFTQNWLQDLVATILTFAIALAWLRLLDALAARGVIEQRLSRKLIHIGTGPLFVLCWNFFSPAPWARFLAALVPLAITGQFLLVGLGVIKDPAAVQAMSRTGDRREILKGPLYYGLIFVACTIAFWRHSPVGILALMIMCGGDGLAEIVGRRYGTRPIYAGSRKTRAGSIAMFLGGFVFGFGFLWLFNVLGDFQPAMPVGQTALSSALITLIAAGVETLPFEDVDNITTTAAAVILGLILF
jgi:phytol kinase